MSTMVEFQTRRRRELELWAAGYRKGIEPPGTAIKPDDPSEAAKAARWWTKSHLNLTRSLADVGGR